MRLSPQRELFDLPREICYLNAAFMSPFPKRFEALARAAAAERLRPWEVHPPDFFERSERVRGLAARVFDTSPETIALVPAVSYAVATAVRNLRLGPGDVILTLDEEFPSNYYGWARAAYDSGARLERVPGPPERDWTAALAETLERYGESVALVAVPHVHWSSGAMLDLAAVREMTRGVDAALFLDLTQSLGALPVSIREIRPDFAVAAGYKWLFGPYALGYLHVAEEWLDGRPLEENWILRAGSEDFSRLVDYSSAYQPGARRFDMGERSNFTLMPLAEAALELVLEWGVEAIAESLQALNARLAAALEAADFTCTPAQWRAPHLMAARHPAKPAADIAAAWREAGVIVSTRGNWLRIAPHVWIDSQDEERFIAAVNATSRV